MLKSLGIPLSGQPNVKLTITTNAPILYWAIFDAGFQVVVKGDAASPKPLALPPGDYLCEMKFGPADEGTSATMTMVTTCSDSPYTVTGAISNRPTARIDLAFSVC